MAVASLVLGIISIIIGAVSGGLVGWLGAIGRKNPEHKGIATGGLVCSIIGLVLSLILYIACIGCTAGLASLY